MTIASVGLASVTAATAAASSLTTTMVPSYYVWMVFIIPLLGAVIVPFLGRSRYRDYVAVSFSLLSAIFALLLLVPVLQGRSISLYDSVIPTSLPWIPELGINVGVLSDPYTLVLVNVVAWISFLVMVYSLDYMKGDSGLMRYWFFMNFFIGSMQLIVLSDNLLSLFIGWEGVGLCSYALIGYYYRDEKADWVGTPGTRVLGEEQAYPPSHAGLKAFFMTRVGDLAMLAGILILFVYAGTFNFHQLATSSGWAVALSKNGLLVPAALLIFGGAIGKSAQFPLQEWLPDAMAGPAPVSALIHAATMVNAGVVLVARVGPIFYFILASNPSLIQPFFVAVAWIGAFTAFLAASQALVGYELKKILAYSTISQIGYMVMALGVAGLSTNFAVGLSAGLFQLLSHAIFKAALFLMAGVLIHATGSKYINEMGGLKDRLKITFAVFLIAAASLAGIPPLGGFWSKDAVLSAAWSSGQIGLFLVGTITAGITAFYAFRMVGIVFFGQRSATNVGRLEGDLTGSNDGGGHPLHDARPLAWVPYAILGAGTVVVGLLGFFNLGGALQSVSSSYLTSLFGAAAILTAAGTAAGETFNYTAAAITLAFVVVGLLLAGRRYVLRRPSAPAERVGAESGFAQTVHTFLVNRWYINAIYYKVFVDAPLGITEWTAIHFERDVLQRVNTGGEAFGLDLSAASNWFDVHVVEEIVDGFSTVGQAVSRVARRLQTGIVEQYAQIFIIGLVAMLILFILLTGAYTLL